MDNKVFQHSLHRELWQWLADNPGMQKDDWPRWEINGGNVIFAYNDCFACNYASTENSLVLYRDIDCDSCPLGWTKEYCCDEGAEFDQWDFTLDPQERTRLALLIKDLPVKDGVVTE